MHTKPIAAIATEPVAERVAPYAWYALALLTLVYVLNFLDRTLIYILFTPIKQEMNFTDTELAFIGPTSFAIFYTLLGIPFGRMADRATRKYLIAIGLAVWSIFSGLTGFASSFSTIFLCRVMVGVGEATLRPAALSLLSDYFPPRMRATTQAVYSSGIAIIGGGIAYFLGGWIAQNYGWRWAFYLLGFPGLLLAVLVILLREEPRGRVVRVNYEDDKPPWIASRLQDFFGMREGTAIAGGRVPLVLHLLAPNGRPVQVTSDLSGFWERHYKEVRRELSRRYPRHAWPEDPLKSRDEG